jgi:CRP/FNR family cyclic AMP-dependent transcriptional regulator
MEWRLLAPLTSGERAAVVAATRRMTVGKGDVLFHEGQEGDSVHLLVRGHLAVRVATPDGDRATLNVLGPGEHVGELALVDRSGPHRRSATVMALEPVETLVLSAPAFYALCDRHPRVQGLLVDLLAHRVRELSSRLLETMYLDLEQRLCRRLLFLAEIYQVGDGQIVLPLTQEQLADLAGGSRPSLNQVLQRLVDHGLVTVGRGRIVIPGREALARLRRSTQELAP